MIKNRTSACVLLWETEQRSFLLLIFKAVSGFPSVYSVNSAEGDGSPAAVATERHQPKPESLAQSRWQSYFLEEINDQVYREERKSQHSRRACETCDRQVVPERVHVYQRCNSLSWRYQHLDRLHK